MKVNVYGCVKTGLQTEKGPFLAKGKEYYYALGRLIPVGNFIESGYIISEELVENIRFLQFIETANITDVFGSTETAIEPLYEEFNKLIEYVNNINEEYKYNLKEATEIINRLIRFAESSQDSAIVKFHSYVDYKWNGIKKGLIDE